MEQSVSGSFMPQSTSFRPQLTLSTNILYGVGSIAFGVGTLSALLLFYNQVVGLPASWVSAALMVTLIFDAFCDPLIGHWSDHARSRWGRRHPFMYASAVPVAVSIYWLYHPPLGWSQSSLLIYLVAMLVTVRLLLSLYEIPSAALGPELTLDYHQRTSLMSWRFFFGTLGGAGISVLALQVFLRKDAMHPLGLLYRPGWGEAGVAAAIAGFLSIMISSLGTHRFIASLVHKPAVRGEWREKLQEVSGMLTNRSFLVLMIAGIVGAISSGLKDGLQLYITTYFFELTPQQISYLVGLTIPAALGGVTLAPLISRRFEKKPAMISVFFASLVAGPAPIAMRLVGIAPPNGTGVLLAIIIVFHLITQTLAIMGFIIASSMMADVVEDVAVSTKQRSEGLLFAANGLIAKCVSGVGTFFSGLILAWISFPQHAVQGQVDPAILHHLGMIFVPVTVTFSAIAITVLMFYDIDRSKHQTNVERLESVLKPDAMPALCQTRSTARS
jgi:glycoside/pentoside/hexuronide:cation symporter, GPH family